MFKWFALFLILTVAVGAYWFIMTGTWADRNIDMQLQGIKKEPTVADVLNRLEAIQERLDVQEMQVKKLGFIARDPDWSNIEAARKEMHRLVAEAHHMIAEGRDEAQTDAAATIRAQVAELPPLTAETFHPRQRTFWAVIFWVLSVPTVLFGLLSFVRAAPG